MIMRDEELDRLRMLLLKYWKALVAKGFGTWCQHQRRKAKDEGVPVDLEAIRIGAAALAYAAEATWWEWPRGSAPFFWNWPEEYQALIREGLPPATPGTPQHLRSLNGGARTQRYRSGNGVRWERPGRKVTSDLQPDPSIR